MAAFDWVKARAKCSVGYVFQILGEVVEADVKAVNALDRQGVEFKIRPDATDRFIVTRQRNLGGGFEEMRAISFELRPNQIVVIEKARGVDDRQLFSAHASLNQDGECFLEVAGESLRLWQVSRKALEDLFFGF